MIECEDCGYDMDDSQEMDDLKRDLTRVKEISSVQQRQLEEARENTAAMTQRIGQLEADNNALRARLTAVALVIRP
jgi:hypothetical protein